MPLSQYFPVYDKLTKEEQERLEQVSMLRTVEPGTILHGVGTCIGILVIRKGQLRAHLNSEEGREITLYRLFDHDICLFTASCMMNSIQFEITITAEKETECWVIPPLFYRDLMERHAAVANYTNELMASRFSEVMWLIEQIMWKSFDKRLSRFLLEESVLEGTNDLKITHEVIAGHLGTAREVVTRMLKYFQTEGMVRLGRGTVSILDEKALAALDK